MRLRTFNLIRYGKFTHQELQLPYGEPDIHLIVGANEAGKSTLRRAMGDWLFGIHPRTPMAFRHPMPELRLGGVLERRGRGEAEPAASLAFHRTKGNKQTLRSPDDQPLPDTHLQPWLGHWQAADYVRMYALDHRALVEGGDGILSAADDVGRLLFQSASGLQHLDQTLQQLQAEADALWGPRRAAARVYYQAADVHEAAQAEIRALTLRSRDWKQVHDDLAQTEAQLHAAKEDERQLRQQLSRLERIQRVRPLLQTLDEALAQQAEWRAGGDTPWLDADAGALLARCSQDLALAEADGQRLLREVEQAREHWQSTWVDQEVLALAEAITEFNERRLQYRAHRSDLLKRAEEVHLEWVQVQQRGRDLGWNVDSEAAVRACLPAAAWRARLARLLKQRPERVAALKAAQQALGAREAQLQQAEAEYQQLAVWALDPAWVQAVEQAIQLGDHEGAMATWQAQIEALDQQIQTGVQGLGAWSRPLDELASMVLPDVRQVQDLIDQQRADAAEARRTDEALQTCVAEREQMDLALQQWMRHVQPITDEQVQQARSARDATWQSMQAAPQSLHDRAEVFTGQMAWADRLADERQAAARHEAERQSRQEALAHKRHEQQLWAQRQQAVQARIAERQSHWSALTRVGGLPDLPLEMALTWLPQRQRLLDLAAERAALQRRLAAQQQGADRLRALLWPPLAPDHDSAEPPAFGVCLRLARAQLSRAEQLQGQRQALEQQMREAQSQCLALRTALRVAQDDWDAWTDDWAQTLQAAGQPPALRAEDIEADLLQMQDIEHRLDRIQTIRRERIDTMQADLDALAATASGLAQRLAPDLIDRPPEELALELNRRLALAQEAQTRQAEAMERLTRQQAAWAEACAQQDRVRARLQPLLLAAGVQDLSALARAIERSDAGRALAQRLSVAEQALSAAADGWPLETLRQECADLGDAALRQDRAQLGETISEVVERIAALSHRYGELKSRFDVLDGRDAVAKAEARRQEAIASMADAAERYLQLQTAARLLKWSIDTFRETQQGPMLSRASGLFQGLTLGSFHRLLVDTGRDQPRLLGVRPDGEAVDVAGMSEGSRDQLYLALRLAALELQVEQGRGMPLIADDLFVNFDDQRTAAGLRVLGDCARHMQVLFLTHHEHLVPLAREVLGPGLNVVRL